MTGAGGGSGAGKLVQLEVQVQARDERCQVFGSTSGLPTRASFLHAPIYQVAGAGDSGSGRLSG